LLLERELAGLIKKFEVRYNKMIRSGKGTAYFFKIHLNIVLPSPVSFHIVSILT
jgi:hypothetical protein